MSIAPQPSSAILDRRAITPWAIACGCFALTVYAFTLGPTVTGEDSGELITAAYTLGIAHPPGYPLWCLLGKAFTFIPVGTVAWRVNFMSAIFGAATVALVFLLIARLTKNRIAAAAGSLAFAFSKEFWEQCVIAEVYTLNAFLVALSVLLLTIWYEDRRNRYLIGLAIVTGLGLANHHTILFLAPVFALFVLVAERKPWAHWEKYLALSALSLGVGAVLYAYLPIRSMANPPADWGNPETRDGFWEVVLRKQYAFAFTDDARTPARFLKQCGVFLKNYAFEFTPVLAILPLFGLRSLWRRSRMLSGLLVGVFSYVALGFIVTLNFDFDKQTLWLNNVFWLPAYMMAAILLGIGVHNIANERLRGRVAKVATVVLLAAAVGFPLALNYRTSDKSDYYFAHDFGMNVLRTMEQDAIYFPLADHATFPVQYLQAVEGIRTDVTIANKYGYPEPEVYADMPREVREGFGTYPSASEERFIERWVVEHNDRPVYFTNKRFTGSRNGFELVNTGLLFRAVRDGQTAPDADYWAAYEWHTVDPNDTRGDLTAEIVLSDYFIARGREHLEAGETDEGLEALQQAKDVIGSSQATLINIGTLCAEYDLFAEAIRHFAAAEELDAEYPVLLANMAKVHFHRGEHGKALEYAERYLVQEPIDPEVNWLASDCLKAQGRYDETLAQLRRMGEFMSQDYRIPREMGFIHLNEKRDRIGAQRYFARSLQLNPNQPELQQALARTDVPNPLDALPNPMQGLAPNPQVPQVPQPIETASPPTASTPPI